MVEVAVMMNFIEDKIALRLGGKDFENTASGYKFAAIKKMKAEAKQLHPELPLIDLGVGEPDQAANSGIVEMLSREAGKAENRFYADNGIPEFQEAAAGYMEKAYGVKGLDPNQQILHGIGSKPILAMLPLLFINPGDVALTTVPGYPVLGTYTRYLGGEAYPLPLWPENDFYPDFSAIPSAILKRAKLLYINYPNNPTGQVATLEFYRQVVEFAYRNQIMIVSDASYAALTYDGHHFLSFLSVDGAGEVGVEIHSLSKAFNMTGWRLAFLAGNPKIIKAYGMVKDNTDSGQFRAIQKAGVYALNHPELAMNNCERYSRRLDLLVKVLREVGLNAVKPAGTFYCYVPIPKGTGTGIRFETAAEVAEFLLREALISVIPWDHAGSYLRFSVTFEADGEEAEIRVMEELKRRLLRLGLVF
jgi:LL-diaminopimelate aminotransferase